MIPADIPEAFWCTAKVEPLMDMPPSRGVALVATKNTTQPSLVPDPEDWIAIQLSLVVAA
jgi:hypothetical protein